MERMLRMHACVHAYAHACVQSSVGGCMRSWVRACMHACVRACMQSSVLVCVHATCVSAWASPSFDAHHPHHLRLVLQLVQQRVRPIRQVGHRGGAARAAPRALSSPTGSTGDVMCSSSAGSAHGKY